MVPLYIYIQQEPFSKEFAILKRHACMATQDGQSSLNTIIFRVGCLHYSKMTYKQRTNDLLSIKHSKMVTGKWTAVI